jgi:hypothetical protein
MDLFPPAMAPAHVLPEAGAQTFLFTEVEGSSLVWKRVRGVIACVILPSA